MAKIVFDASSVVGALLKQGSIPEQALLLARANDTICLSPAVDDEIRNVVNRPKFKKYLAEARIERILAVLTAAAVIVEPNIGVTDVEIRKTTNISNLHLPHRRI
jgi:uncharacterized protein